MGTHYPLNGLDLDFRRYAHRPIEGCDVFFNRIMTDLLSPRRLLPEIYDMRATRAGSAILLESSDRELFLDIRVLWKILHLQWHPFLTRTVQEMFLEMARAHYFLRDPLIRQANKSHCFDYYWRLPGDEPGWDDDMIDHLALYQKGACSVNHRYSVYSGNSRLSFDQGARNAKLSLGSPFLAVSYSCWGPIWPPSMREEAKRSGYLTLPKNNKIHRRRPSRSQSVPDLRRWGFLSWVTGNLFRPAWFPHFEKIPIWGIPSSSSPQTIGERVMPYVPFLSYKSIDELQKLSRRRSLSRSHIRAMFIDKPEWIVEDDMMRKRNKNPCSNCAQYNHSTNDCPSNCGYCNSDAHKSQKCTLKPENRCKCKPFPQFHRSRDCHVRCTRRCGSSHPPGAYRHINAMTCSHRCCMCGARGHSGRKCSMKKCPCGQQHLTQDCRWKVECAAKDCHFYLCHLHCRECGRKRDKDPENAFVGRTCQDCLKNGISVSGRAA